VPRDPNLTTEPVVVDGTLKAVFDYLDKEMTLQGSATAISGGAAVWVIREIVLDTKAQAFFGHTGEWLMIGGSGLLLIAAVFFFLERSRLANKYWQIARSQALPQSRLSRPVSTLISSLDLVRWGGRTISRDLRSPLGCCCMSPRPSLASAYTAFCERYDSESLNARSNPSIYQLKVTLLAIEPPNWRRIQVSSAILLCCLHDALQVVIGCGRQAWAAFRLARFKGKIRENIASSEKSVGH
jgi:hypothetical protein